MDKKEIKIAISCYLKATKESTCRDRKQMYNLLNEMGMFEIEKQHLACQARSILRNKRLKEIEIQQLQKEIEKDEIVPDRVDTVLEMSCGGSNGTETVREQCCDLENYPGDIPEHYFENSSHQCLKYLKGQRKIYQPYVAKI